MQRYFLKENISEKIILSAETDVFKHFGKVLRAKIGTKAEFVGLDRSVVVAQVTEMTQRSMTLNVVDRLTSHAELPIDVTLVVSPLKNDRSDWFVQKATELGVNHIVFTNMVRTVANWQKQLEKKQTRLNKIAQAAAEQSHRLMIPEISFLTWQDMLKAPKDLGLVAWEESAKAGETSTLVKSLSQIENGARTIVVFGPEGGLTSEELVKLMVADFKPAGLGPRILRAETAPLYVLSAMSVLRELNATVLESECE